MISPHDPLLVNQRKFRRGKKLAVQYLWVWHRCVEQVDPDQAIAHLELWITFSSTKISYWIIFVTGQHPQLGGGYHPPWKLPHQGTSTTALRQQLATLWRSTRWCRWALQLPALGRSDRPWRYFSSNNRSNTRQKLPQEMVPNGTGESQECDCREKTKGRTTTKERCRGERECKTDEQRQSCKRYLHQNLTDF